MRRLRREGGERSLKKLIKSYFNNKVPDIEYGYYTISEKHYIREIMYFRIRVDN